jgi:hypothetical protein
MEGCDDVTVRDGRGQPSHPDGPEWPIPEGDKTRKSGAMCKPGPDDNSTQEVGGGA